MFLCYILIYNRKCKVELKFFLLLMKSINVNSYRKCGIKSLEKKRGILVVCFVGNVNMCVKEYNVIVYEIVWYFFNRFELLVMGVLKLLIRIIILNNGIKIVILLCYIVLLYLKEVMYLSKEIDNYFIKIVYI